MSDCSSDEDETFVAFFMYATILQRKRRRNRTVWVRPILGRREELGTSTNLVREMELEDRRAFKDYFRMSTEEFNRLFAKLEPGLTKKTTQMREPIPARTKLHITLRYLATGRSFRDLETDFRVSRATIALFVPDCCQMIFDAIKDEYMKVCLF